MKITNLIEGGLEYLRNDGEVSMYESPKTIEIIKYIRIKIDGKKINIIWINIFTTTMSKQIEDIKSKKYDKKVLRALIWTLFVYPNHARCGFDTILKTGKTFLPLWIGDNLSGQNDLLENVIALIDNEGRENTARRMQALLPEYTAYFGEPICTVWLNPPPYRGPFDEKNSPM